MFLNIKLVLAASCFVSALGQRGGGGADVFDDEKRISNSPDLSRGEIPDPDQGICPAGTDRGGRALRAPQPRWKGRDVCSIGQPGDVVNFRVRCRGASYLDFQIADCCVPQDHWQLKGKAWDVAPQTAVTTSPGPRNQYYVPARVYNYGGTANNPRTLDALIKCCYCTSTA